MPKITDACRSMRADRLLPLQVPSLVLRQMHLFLGNRQARWNEVCDALLHLSQCVSSFESVNKCGIGRGGGLEQAVGFVRREVAGKSVKGGEVRCVEVERFGQIRWQWIVKDAEAAAQYAVVRNAQGLPGKAEAR